MSNTQFQYLSSSISKIYERLESGFRTIEGIASRLTLLEQAVNRLSLPVPVPAPTPAPTPAPAPIIEKIGKPMNVILVKGPKSEIVDLTDYHPEFVFVTIAGAGDLGEKFDRRVVYMNGSTGRLIVTAGLAGGNTLGSGNSTVEPETYDGTKATLTAIGEGTGEHGFVMIEFVSEF